MCELQNYTLELEVDSQSYTIADTKRETKNWSSVLHYDAGLCIVCERCTTVCQRSDWRLLQIKTTKGVEVPGTRIKAPKGFPLPQGWL